MPYAVQRVKEYDLKKKFGAPVQELTESGSPQYVSQKLLVGWWRLNTDVSSDGDVPDSSNNSNSGTFDAPANRPGYSTVLYPSSRIQVASNTFDDSNDAINIGTADTWNSIIGNYGIWRYPPIIPSYYRPAGGTSKMSFSAWVYKTHASTTLGRIIHFGQRGAYSPTGGAGFVSVWTDGDERIHFGTCWNGSDAAWYTPTGAITQSTWAHVVVTYDASSVLNVPAIYVDGVALSITFDTGTTAPSVGANFGWDGIGGSGIDDDCYIGNNSDLDAPFGGNLADIAVWNRRLSADDAKAIYRAASYSLWFVSRNFRLRGSSTSGEDIDRFSAKEDGEFGLSINPFRQGINVNEMKYVELGLTPKIFSGTRPKIILNGVDMSAQKYFDDAVIANSTDVRLTSGSRKEVPNFEMEIQNLGQAKVFNDDVPYTEMQKFNSVAYLTDDTGAMVYPYVGSNPAAKDPYQADGVIEPLYQIRDSLSLMSIDFPFLAQGVRGTIQGEYTTDSHGGGIAIKQQINEVSSSLSPYEDNTEYFGPAPYSITDSEGNTAMTGSIPLPGWLTDQQSQIDPWVDNTAMGIYTDELSLIARSGDVLQDFITALDVMSGTNTQSMFDRHHRSSASGFTYDNNPLGTDSIAFGGWKK